MLIVSIEKLGDKIFGCLDDGIHYQVFSVDSGCPVEFEEKYYRNNYEDYDNFVLFYSGIEPGALILEEPFHAGAINPEDLSYELLLDIWNKIWPADA